MRTFETDRLIVRPFTADDAQSLHREIYSDPEVLVYFNGGKLFTLGEVQSFLPGRSRGGQFGYWAVERKDDRQLVGQVHLSPYINMGWYEIPDDDKLSPFRNLEVELAFVFGKRFWGNGYASEACRPIIRYAFVDLGLRRLVGGANGLNDRSIRLQQRLGYRTYLSSDGTSVATVLDNPLTAYTIRAFREEDREAAGALGTPVIDWWHAKGPDASLHLVAVLGATGQIVGQLQAVDQGVPEPSRRPGQCHFSLDVAQDHRRLGVGGALYTNAEAFARRRGAHLLYAAYVENDDAPAAAFLQKRGFEALERFYPSYLDLDAFDPSRFQPAIEEVKAQGIRLLAYQDLGDTGEHRLKLYELEQLARATQPFLEVGPYIPEAYEEWERDFEKRDLTTVFLAIPNSGDEWAGVVTGLEWYFTGVHPIWRGRGIATALKVNCITEAKKRGIVRMETENHGDNAAMIAVNRKLGFVFTAPEVACVKRF